MPNPTGLPRSGAVAPPVGSADVAEAIARVDIAELGTRLRDARSRAGLTQAELAKGVLSEAYLCRIEKGQRRPSLHILQALADRLGSSTHEMLLGITPQTMAEKAAELDWAQLALRTGDAAKALTRIEGLLADLPPESRLYRTASFYYARALEATGSYEQATIRLEELAETESDGVGALDILNALSRCYRLSGELGRAIEIGERGSRLLKEYGFEGTPEGVRLILTTAAAHAEQGDVGYASRLCQRALKHAETLRSPAERAGCYWNASILESRRGNHAEAVALADKALHILDEADSARSLAQLRTQVGILCLRTDPPQIDEALAHLKQAENELEHSAASPADQAQNWLAQARAHYLLGDFVRAGRDARDCLDKVAGQLPIVEADAHSLLGQIALAAGQVEEAKVDYRQAVARLSAAGSDRGAAQTWYELGGLLLAVGCNDDALDAFQRAGASTGLQAVAATQAIPAGVPSMARR